MKKRIRIVCLLICCSICMTACSNYVLQETTKEYVDVATENHIIDTTVNESDEIISSDLMESTGNAKEEMLDDPFESFMLFPSDRGYFYGKKLLIPEASYHYNVPQLMVFRVVGIEDEYQGDFTVYEIQLMNVYGLDNFPSNKIYRMAYRGHLEDQLYGRPPLEIGSVYARLISTSEADLQRLTLFQAGLVMPVVEVDGVQYLYGYGVDFSDMECKIAITNKEENSIYKAEKHYKVIAALNELNQVCPTFDYKCELKSFYEEILNRCR